MAKRRLLETDIPQSNTHNKKQKIDSDGDKNRVATMIPIIVNGKTKEFPSDILQNLEYFQNRLSGLWIDNSNNQSNCNNNNNNENEKQCVFEQVPFDMEHFELLLKYVKLTETTNNKNKNNTNKLKRAVSSYSSNKYDKTLKKAISEIQTTSVLDVQGFACCCDYFAVTNIKPTFLLKWYEQCDSTESTRTHLSNWKQSKCKLLRDLYLKIELCFVDGQWDLKSNTLAMKDIWLNFEVFLHHRNIERNFELLKQRERREMQLRLIYLLQTSSNGTRFDQMMQVLRSVQLAVDILNSKATNLFMQQSSVITRKLNVFPFIECLYFGWNCLVEYGNKSENIVAPKHTKKLKEFISSLHTLVATQAAFCDNKSDYDPQGNVAYFKFKWFDGINTRWNNKQEHNVIIAHLMKLVLWESISYHWPMDHWLIVLSDYDIVKDQEFVKSLMEKCNQLECIHLATFLRGINMQYSLQNLEWKFLYSDLIKKHTGVDMPSPVQVASPWQ